MESLVQGYIELRHSPQLVTQFFNKVERMWIYRYGYDLPFGTDPEVEPEHTPGDVVLPPLLTLLGEAEVQRRVACGKEARKVRVCLSANFLLDSPL
jgi:hypothetical protein